MRKTFSTLLMVAAIGGLAIIFSLIYNSPDKEKINSASNLAWRGVKGVIDLVIKISNINTFGIQENPNTQLMAGSLDYLEKDVIEVVNSKAELTNWLGSGKIIDWQKNDEDLTIIFTGVSGQEHSWTLPIKL